jgi:hypothetical protein
MRNGKGPEDEKSVVSLAEARRRREEQVRRLRAETGADDRARVRGRRSLREIFVGAVLVLLALAMVASYVAPLFVR